MVKGEGSGELYTPVISLLNRGTSLTRYLVEGNVMRLAAIVRATCALNTPTL